MKKIAIFIMTMFIMLFGFTMISAAEVSDEEEKRDQYYQSIVDTIVSLDGEYESEDYKLVNLQNSGDNKSKRGIEEDENPNAVQVTTYAGNEVCVDTFFPYTYDKDGNFVNAFEASAYDKNFNYNGVFDGATVKCRAKYKYMSNGGNYYFYPREFGVTWLGGGSVYSIDAHFFARGVLLADSNLTRPINPSYLEQLDVYQSNPEINVEYTDSAEPYSQIIGIWDYLKDGGFISIIVNGVEDQYTVVDKSGAW